MNELSEREQYVQHLLGFGWTPEEIEAKFRDSDLWVLEPALRVANDLEGLEAVRQWEQAAQLLDGVAHWVMHIAHIDNTALLQLILDAAERAHGALHRTRQRVQEASEE